MALLIRLTQPALAQDPEFSEVEELVLNEVTIVACAHGKNPCVPGRADLGCVPETLSGNAFERACRKFEEARADFTYSCSVNSKGKLLFVGTTRSEEVCQALQKIWDELAADPFFLKKSETWRMNFMKQTLLQPRGHGRKDNPGLASQLGFKKNGKLKRSSDVSERLLEKARANLKDYRDSMSCGVGIIPGMDQVPVLNQNLQGTCFAHASATLIDYVRKVRGGAQYPTYSSPLMGAIDFHLNSKEEIKSCKDPMRGGNACEAFNSTIARGFCSSEKIERAISKSFLMTGKAKSLSWHLDWAKRQNLSLSLEEFKLKPNDPVLEYLSLIGSLYKEKNWERLKELRSSLILNGGEAGACQKDPLRWDLAWEIIKLSSNLESFYALYFESLCQREPFPFEAACASRGAVTSAELDKILEKGYPVGIRYCMSVLQNRNFKSPSVPISDSDSCGRHASVLVGTAIDSKGRCTYVVRNSWGKQCAGKGYDRDFDCRDGHLYVPKETLIRQIYGVQEVSLK
jgi:hypothetical protein